MKFKDRIFQLAPKLSTADAAMLIAALTTGDEARSAYRYWRERLVWEVIPAHWQRLLPLLHRNLSLMGIEDDLTERMKGVRRFMWARNLRLITLAKTVHGEFARASIPALSLKGASLVASSYVNRSVRPMDDIDVLIPAARMSEAIDVLAQIGFQPRFIRPSNVVNRLIPDRQVTGWPFINDAGDEVDVHWNAMHLDRRIDSDREAWSESRVVEFEGTAIRVPSTIDQLIQVCAHGARDPDSKSIRWIADALIIVQHSGNLDWPALVELARTHRLSAVMANALDLLKALFDLPINSQTIVLLRNQSSWSERLEVHLWNQPSERWNLGISGHFLAIQAWRRGQTELFDASFATAVHHLIVASAGTRSFFAAVARHLYFALGKPRLLRAILAPDRRLALDPIDQLPILADIDFAGPDCNETMFPFGWSIAERSGRWSVGHSATMAFRLEKAARRLPLLSFDIAPAINPDHPELQIAIFVNEHRVAVRQFGRNSPLLPLVCSVPDLASPTTLVLVTFEIMNPHPPSKHGISADPRHLGLFISGLSIVASSGPTASRAELVSSPEGDASQSSGHTIPAPDAEKMSLPILIEMREMLSDRIEMNEHDHSVLEQLKALDWRVADLEKGQERLQAAYSRTRANLRRLWIRPPMWTFEQHTPRALNTNSLQVASSLPAAVPTIAIVTPSFNHERFLRQTIDSVLSQNYPNLFYHVQDGGSDDGSVKVLESYGDRISWRSEPDHGQSDAINRGFNGKNSEIMAYLNSDDTLLPGTLAYIANFFHDRPDVDIVYGHRVFIDNEGFEIGRAILPAHSDHALRYAGYVPQETMFWRRRVWDKVGEIDIKLQYALDWDFMLRAQAAGFKFARARRFLACFRVHDAQKTSKNYDIGRSEMRDLRLQYLGYVPTQSDIYRALFPYLLRQSIFHWTYRLGLLKQ